MSNQSLSGISLAGFKNDEPMKGPATICVPETLALGSANTVYSKIGILAPATPGLPVSQCKFGSVPDCTSPSNTPISKFAVPAGTMKVKSSVGSDRVLKPAPLTINSNRESVGSQLGRQLNCASAAPGTLTMASATSATNTEQRLVVLPLLIIAPLRVLNLPAEDSVVSLISK